MSMHEVEDLVEQSVRMLGATARPKPVLRSCYAALYEFQNEWDTGYTHFRVMDLLRAACCVYALPLAEYPDPIDANSTEGWVELPGHDTPTYCEEGTLYIDAGSPAWATLVKAGRLSGPDAVAPTGVDLFELALDISRLAVKAAARRVPNSAAHRSPRLAHCSPRCATTMGLR